MEADRLAHREVARSVLQISKPGVDEIFSDNIPIPAASRADVLFSKRDRLVKPNSRVK